MVSINLEMLFAKGVDDFEFLERGYQDVLRL